MIFSLVYRLLEIMCPLLGSWCHDGVIAASFVFLCLFNFVYFRIMGINLIDVELVQRFLGTIYIGKTNTDY
jgi:hypothetical protein